MEFINGLMEIFMMDSGKITKETFRVFINGQMATNIMEIGVMTKEMDLV